MPEMVDLETLVPVREYAGLKGRTQEWIKGLLRAGRLEGRKIGNQWFVYVGGPAEEGKEQ